MTDVEMKDDPVKVAAEKEKKPELSPQEAQALLVAGIFSPISHTSYQSHH